MARRKVENDILHSGWQPRFLIRIAEGREVSLMQSHLTDSGSEDGGTCREFEVAGAFETRLVSVSRRGVRKGNGVGAGRQARRGESAEKNDTQRQEAKCFHGLDWWGDDATLARFEPRIAARGDKRFPQS